MVVTLKADDGSELVDGVNATFYASTGGGAAAYAPPSCVHAPSCSLHLQGLATGLHTVTWTATTHGRPILDQASVSWTVDVCKPTEFGSIDVDTGLVACSTCPEGAVCEGNVTADSIVSQPGWWRVPANQRGEAPLFMECRIKTACAET